MTTVRKLSSPMPQAQRVVSRFGLLMTFLLIASSLTFGLKEGPLCVDDIVKTDVYNNLIQSGGIWGINVRDPRNRVTSSLQINDALDFDTSAITLTRENGQASICIEYESKVELTAYQEEVARFNHRVV